MISQKYLGSVSRSSKHISVVQTSEIQVTWIDEIISKSIWADTFSTSAAKPMSFKPSSMQFQWMRTRIACTQQQAMSKISDYVTCLVAIERTPHSSVWKTRIIIKTLWRILIYVNMLEYWRWSFPFIWIILPKTSQGARKPIWFCNSILSQHSETFSEKLCAVPSSQETGMSQRLFKEMPRFKFQKAQFFVEPPNLAPRVAWVSEISKSVTSITSCVCMQAAWALAHPTALKIFARATSFSNLSI